MRTWPGAHWDGLPDGHTRATTLDPQPDFAPSDEQRQNEQRPPDPLAALLAHRPNAATPVARRALSIYDTAAGLAETGLPG